MMPATPPDPVHFVYSVSAECPTKDEFAKLVSDRGNALTESETAPRTLDVTMAVDPNHREKWHGSLRVADGTNARSERTIEGTSCADVAHSLAIFTSIALTPVLEPQPSTPAASAATTTTTAPRPQPASTASPAASADTKPDYAYGDPDLENAPDLHRHRFALSAQTLFSEQVLQPSRALGVGVTARYYFSERFGLKLDADFMRTTGSQERLEYGMASDGTVTTHFQPAEEIGGKGMISGEFLLNRATGSLVQGGFGWREIPADLFLDGGIGAVWTRPLSYNDPQFRTFSYQPDIAFELGFGSRMFVTNSFAITLGIGFTFYNAHQENTVRATTDAERADSTMWFGPSALQADLTASLGFEFLLPGEKAARRDR